MKLRNLQALRALAALMVVSNHLPRLEAKIFPAGLMAGAGAGGAIGVDLFFIISGYIMITTTYSAFGKPGAARDFLERRILRIYPPYWIAMLTFVLVSVVAPNVQHANDLTPWNFVASFALLPHNSNPVMVIAWSLQFEMYFYLVFALALRFERRYLGPIVGIWIALTLALNVWANFTNNVAVDFIGNPLSFEFMAGVGLGITLHTRRIVSPVAILALGSVLTIAVAIYSSRFDGFASHELQWYRVLVAGPGMAMLVYGAVGIERRYGWNVPPFFVNLGDASYTLYLWHGMMLGAFTFVIGRLHPRGTIGDIAYIIGGYVVVSFGALLVYRIVELPLLRAFKRFGRSAPRRVLEPRPNVETALPTN